MIHAVQTVVLILLVVLEVLLDVISLIVGVVIYSITMPFVLLGLVIHAFIKRNKDV